MALLIAIRIAVTHLAPRRAADRKRLIDILLGHEGQAGSAALPANISRKLLTNLSVELIQLVQGEDRKRFIATATAMGVPERLRYDLDSGSPRSPAGSGRGAGAIL